MGKGGLPQLSNRQVDAPCLQALDLTGHTALEPLHGGVHIHIPQGGQVVTQLGQLLAHLCGLVLRQTVSLQQLVKRTLCLQPVLNVNAHQVLYSLSIFQGRIGGIIHGYLKEVQGLHIIVGLLKPGTHDPKGLPEATGKAGQGCLDLIQPVAPIGDPVQLIQGFG